MLQAQRRAGRSLERLVAPGSNPAALLLKTTARQSTAACIVREDGARVGGWATPALSSAPEPSPKTSSPTCSQDGCDGQPRATATAAAPPPTVAADVPPLPRRACTHARRIIRAGPGATPSKGVARRHQVPP